MQTSTESAESDGLQRTSTIICLIIAAVAVLRLWILPLANSFWLDESLIVWTIRDSLLDAITRAASSPQSVVYSMFEWAVRHVGSSEIVLRVPSVVAAVGALFVYYKLGEESLDRSAGLIFAALFLTVRDIAIQAVSARPYALALLAEAAALLWFLRWIRSGKIRDALVWATCGALASHLQFFFAFPMLIEGVYAISRMPNRTRARPSQILFAAALYLVLVAPAVPQLRMLAREAGSLSISAPTTGAGILIALVPVYILCGVFIMFLVSFLEGNLPAWSRCEGAEIPTLGAMLLLPVLVFAALGIFTNLQLFDARYLLPTVPGMVLLWGWAIRGIANNHVRTMSLAAGMILCTVFIGNEWPHPSLVPNYGHEDWRSADQSLDSSSTLLVYSSLVESRSLAQLQNRDKWGYLMSPVLAYRPEFTPLNAYALPFFAGPDQEAYTNALISGPLRARNSITFVMRDIFAARVWRKWLSNRLPLSGFTLIRSATYGTVIVDTFTR